MFWPNSLIEETLLQRFSDFFKVTDLVYDLIMIQNLLSLLWNLYIFPTVWKESIAESVIKTFNTFCLISAGFS